MSNFAHTYSDRSFRSNNGYLMAGLGIMAIVLATGLPLSGATLDVGLWAAAISLGLAVFGVISLVGLYMQQPNTCTLLNLFGAYKGTDRAEGLRWANPLLAKRRLSLRARNQNTPTLKVNDKRGNPIEISAAVVWRVNDAARAAYSVDDFELYVRVQAEAGLRHLASLYAYDEGEHPDSGEITLRGSVDEVTQGLRQELQARCGDAGVEVMDAKLTHLAYAPEIAQVMLRRQQAEAVISARAKIVQGAVSMVEAALKGLSERSIVELDDERKAAMVSNLLVVLCSDRETQPIVNTGTLYN